MWATSTPNTSARWSGTSARKALTTSALRLSILTASRECFEENETRVATGTLFYRRAARKVLRVFEGGENVTNLASAVSGDDFYGLDFRAKFSIFSTCICACSSVGLERRSPEPKVAGSNPARRTTIDPNPHTQTQPRGNRKKTASPQHPSTTRYVEKRLLASRSYPAIFRNDGCRFGNLSPARIRLRESQLLRDFAGVISKYKAHESKGTASGRAEAEFDRQHGFSFKP